ncbi:hypothetical protein ABS648_23285 [Pseudomonas solani]|jgi:hypothetical protein|uniref:DUF2523 domain-containing protein n=1 Tax=Pseudomonas solani TaxID=2731552 RepID=A0AAU7Y185_9PSED
MQWLWDKISTFFVELFEKVLGWLLDLALWLPKKLWGAILDGLATLIEKIPVPEFLANAGSFFDQIPTGVVFFMQYFAVAEGLSMVTVALLLRFIVRRLPVIG